MQPTTDRSDTKVTAALSVSLEDSIFRFWNDFLAKQISTGRRDVGRMLEVALEFYFDRSTQIAEPDLRRRQALETFLRQVRGEINKSQIILRDTQGLSLDVPYQGVQIVMHAASAESPVETKAYPAPFTLKVELTTYHATLVKQANAADKLVQLITEKIVKHRRAVAQRLKDLSPLLYQQGVTMIANAETHQAASRASALPVSAGAPFEAAVVPSVWARFKRALGGIKRYPDPVTDEIDVKLRDYQEQAAKWSKER